MLKKSPTRRVLIVDDEPLIRWSLAETLIEHGYGIVEAGDGRGAVEALTGASIPIDVIMLDYRLPDSNGLQLLVRIRSVAPASRVVLMTAYGTPEVLTEAIRLGAVCVVNKPIEMHDVPGLVERILAAAPS
jgi:two-component system, NtrC family, response regulator AtoC